jgi:hypothetical protein
VKARVHSRVHGLLLHMRAATATAATVSAAACSLPRTDLGTAGASGREGDGMRLLGWLRRRGDHGMTTAEYAVGTVAACGFGGVLYKIVTSEPIMHLVESLISHALHFLG